MVIMHIIIPSSIRTRNPFNQFSYWCHSREIATLVRKMVHIYFPVVYLDTVCNTLRSLQIV
jgi:hypothetical protein